MDLAKKSRYEKYFCIISLIMFLSCNKNDDAQNQLDILDGEIYFKRIDFNSLYNFKNDKIKEFKRKIDSIMDIKSLL